MFMRSRRVGAVVADDEFHRIRSLPRRKTFEQTSEEEREKLVDLMTWWLRTPNGTQRLRPIQAYTLADWVDVKKHLGFFGGVATIPPGEGKTLISLLIHTVQGAQRPLLITRAQLKKKTLKEMGEIASNWRVPLPVSQGGTLHIMSYEELFREGQMDALKERCPDAISCDESHRLVNKNSAWRRIVRFVSAVHVPMFFLSATSTKRSIGEVAHISDVALRQGSPLPRVSSSMDQWMQAVDEEHEPIHPGALLELVEESPRTAPHGAPSNWINVQARENFKARFTTTPGVVVMNSPDKLDSSLTISEVKDLSVPADIRRVFIPFRKLWETPDGSDCVTGIEMARHAKELLWGMYYRWVWANKKPNKRWLLGRKAWKQFVRHVIHYGPRVTPRKRQELGKGVRMPLDTELQVWNAVAAGDIEDRAPPQSELGITNPWHNWMQIKDTANPATETVWISDYLVDHAQEWLETGKEGILWIEHTAVLHRLAERVGRDRVFGGGDDHIINEKGDRNIVASVTAHREGKNLQMFNRNRFLCVPPGGDGMEQALARTHRAYQKSPEVSAEFAFLGIEHWVAWRQAFSDARHTEQTQGVRQKLLYADVLIETTDDIVLERERDNDPLWSKSERPEKKQSEAEEADPEKKPNPHQEQVP